MSRNNPHDRSRPYRPRARAHAAVEAAVHSAMRGVTCLTIPATALWLVLATPALVLAAEGAAGNPWLELLWKAVNFFALVAVLVYFFRKPLSGALHSGAQAAKSGLGDARTLARNAEDELARQREQIADLQGELARLRDEARAEAADEHERLTVAAQEQSERIQAQSKRQVEQEFNKARQVLKEQLAEETLRLAEEIIQSKMDDATRRRLAGESIEQLGQARTAGAGT